MKNAANWFEIPVVELPRAIRFYEATLADKLRVENFMGTEMAIFPHDKPGVGGALVHFDKVDPSVHGARVYLDVGAGEPALDRALSRAREAGGIVHLSKTSIGQAGWIALVQDSEGNSIGLHAR
jgi:uncharacterized protein